MDHFIPPIYFALVHYPVVNQKGEIVTTSITTFDIHDGARLARSLGVKTAYYVTPIEAQQGMFRYFKEYWSTGFGSRRNPSRAEAMTRVTGALTIESAIEDITQKEGCKPFVVATSARVIPLCPILEMGELVDRLRENRRPLLLLFGTGWGLDDSVFSHCEALLPPIRGRDDYNHLPVRSAIAIYLDRLNVILSAIPRQHPKTASFIDILQKIE